jgi:glycosyltransferase involved in cell wall biosynthesis
MVDSNRALRRGRGSVLMVSYQYAPMVDGGAERQAQRLAEGLADRGRHVGVVTARYPGLPPFERVAGVDVYRVWTVPRPKFFSATFLPSLARFLWFRGRDYDIWHVHQAFYSAGVALVLAQLLGKRCVVKAAASGPFGDIARLSRASLGNWVRRVLPRADAVVSLNSELTEELLAVGIDSGRIHPIPNGVDCRRFAPPSIDQRARERATLGIPPHGTLVVFAGRLAADKGVDYLIDAWRRIEQKSAGESWTLVVAGAELAGNNYRERGERELSSARFLGKVSDVRPLFHAADLVVHPSLTEGLSNVVLEAMATSLPVVGTRIAGVRELIDDGITGLLVAPRNADALVEGLTTVLRDPDLRARMGKAARIRVEQRYSVDAMADAYEDLYERLAHTPTGRRPAGIN